MGFTLLFTFAWSKCNGWCFWLFFTIIGIYMISEEQNEVILNLSMKFMLGRPWVTCKSTFYRITSLHYFLFYFLKVLLVVIFTFFLRMFFLTNLVVFEYFKHLKFSNVYLILLHWYVYLLNNDQVDSIGGQKINL